MLTILSLSQIKKILKNLKNLKFFDYFVSEEEQVLRSMGENTIYNTRLHKLVFLIKLVWAGIKTI